MKVAELSARAAAASEPPLGSVEPVRLGPLTKRLPLSWIASPRRRRLLVLGLAAPGFLAVVTTPVHRNFAVLVIGGLLFAAALGFRRWTEPMFRRAEAAALWPLNPRPASKGASVWPHA